MFNWKNNGFLLRYKDASIKELKKDSPKQLLAFISGIKKLSVDDFVEGNCNFVLRGNNRSGKTYAAHAVGNYLIEKLPKKEFLVWLVTAEDLITFHINNAIIPNDPFHYMTQFLAKVDILIVDDLGKEYHAKKGNYAASIIHSFFRFRFNANKNTIITTELSYEEINTLYSASVADLFKEEYVTYHIILDPTKEKKILSDRKVYNKLKNG